MVLNAASQLLETLDPRYSQAIARRRDRGIDRPLLLSKPSMKPMRKTCVPRCRTTTATDVGISDRSRQDRTLPLTWGKFVVDVVPLGASANRPNRRRSRGTDGGRCAEPSLSLSGVWEKADKACEFDFVRPAAEVVPMPENNEAASASVYDRHVYGRNARQKFYQDEIREGLRWVSSTTSIRWPNGPAQRAIERKRRPAVFPGQDRRLLRRRQ